MHKLAIIFIIIGWIVVAYYIAKLIKKSSQKRKIRLRDKQLKKAFDDFWLHLTYLEYVNKLSLDYDTEYESYIKHINKYGLNKEKFIENMLIDSHWKVFLGQIPSDFFLILDSTKDDVCSKYYLKTSITKNYTKYLHTVFENYLDSNAKLQKAFKPYYDKFPKDFFDVIGIDTRKFYEMFIKWYHKAGEDKVAEFFKTFTDKYDYAKQTQNNRQNKQHHNHQNNGSRNHKTSVVNPYEILQVSQTASKK